EITNSGVSTAVGVKFAFDIADKLQLVTGSVSIDAVSAADSVSDLSVGDIPGGSSATVTFQATVSNPFPIDETEVSKQAGITITSPAQTISTDDPNTAAAGDATVTTIAAAPDLRVTKSPSSASVPRNTLITYTIEYKNCGDQGASGVEITETVPKGTTFSAGDTAWTGTGCTDGAAADTVCTFTHSGDLLVDCSTPQTLAFVVQLDNSLDPTDAGLFPGADTCATGCVQNTVSINDNGNNGADLDTSDNTLLLLEPAIDTAPDVEISASANITADATNSDLIIFTVNYGNIGTADASNVTITAEIPSGATHDQNNSAFTCNTGEAADECTLTVASIAQGVTGQTAQFAIRVDSILTAAITDFDTTFTATLSGTELNDANNSDSVPVAVKAAPDLTVEVSTNDGPATNNKPITYAIQYTNNGTKDSEGVVITETVPANSTHTPVSGDAIWTCGDGSAAVEIQVGDTAAAGETCVYTVGSLPFASGSNSDTVNFSITLGNSITSETVITNSVTIEDSAALNPSELDETNNSASTEMSTEAAPDLNISISTSAITATVDTVLSYTVNYSNDGTADSTTPTITLTVPENTTLVDDTGWAGSGSTRTRTLSSALTQGESGTLDFELVVDSTLTTSVTQIVTAVAIDDDSSATGHVAELVTSNNTASSTTAVSSEADLNITVVGALGTSATEAKPGDTITYTLTYQNLGNKVAINPVITQTIPLNTTFVSSGSDAFDCPQGTSGGLSCTLSVANVGQNESGSALFIVQVDSALDSSADTITSTASIDAGVDLNSADNTSTDEITVADAPDVTIVSVTDNANSDGVSAGDDIEYTITYANIGTATATNVTLRVTVPNDTQDDVASSTSNSSEAWSCSGGVCSLNVGPLTAGEQPAAIIFAVDVANPLSTATVLSGNIEITVNDTLGYELNGGNNSSAIGTSVEAVPDVAITSVDFTPTEANVNDVITYIINYENLGTATATGATLTTTVPTNTSFSEADQLDAGWSCTNSGVAGSACTYTVGNLSINDPRSTKFVVQVESTLLATDVQISYAAAIAAELGDSVELDSTNNDGSANTPFASAPDLQLALAADKTSVTTSDPIVYTLTYANTGTGDATAVVLSIDVPTGTTYTDSSLDADWNCTNGTCTVAVDTLAFGTTGQTAIFTVTSDSDLSAVESISAAASITGAEASQDLNSADNTASEVISLTAAPDLALALAPPNFAIAGDAASFTATYSNSGSTPSETATLTACLPSTATATTDTTWTCESSTTCPFTIPAALSAY
ncbi:MAG: hypothetical protein VX223_04655, partial [Myxococcota bacterium]|nr:hypothetical protein [Myxococcota bacterium]